VRTPNNSVVNASHKNVLRKPDAGNPHVRFDEGRGGRGHWLYASHPVAPLLLYRFKCLSVAAPARCAGWMIEPWSGVRRPFDVFPKGDFYRPSRAEPFSGGPMPKALSLVAGG